METSKRKVQYFTAIKSLFGCYTLLRQGACRLSEENKNRIEFKDTAPKRSQRSARVRRGVVRSKSMGKLGTDEQS